ncbi:hypothetical protein MY11210_001006 [Beauveria gryllotalpidicola]
MTTNKEPPCMTRLMAGLPDSRCPAVRVPNPAVSQKLARASLHLTMLSASFVADAGHFFAARQHSWTWNKLTFTGADFEGPH